MASLQIKTGIVSLDILDDEGNSKGIFKFNPKDIEVAKKVFQLQEDYSSKVAEYEKRASDADTIEKKINLMEDIVTYLKDSIDMIFGAGSSDLLFGTAVSLEMFTDFFEGIMPYFKKASKERMAKYRK